MQIISYTFIAKQSIPMVSYFFSMFAMRIFVPTPSVCV